MGNLAELFISFILASGQWAAPTPHGFVLDANPSGRPGDGAISSIPPEPAPPAAKTFGLSPGDRVRFSTGKGQPVTEGNVVAADPEALLLRLRGVDEPVQIRWSSLRRLEVHRGQHSLARRGEKIGMLAVGVPFAVLTFLSAGGAEVTDSEMAAVALAAGTVAAGIGGVAGMLIGSVCRTDRWDKVDLQPIRVSLTPHRGGGLAVALSWRF